METKRIYTTVLDLGEGGRANADNGSAWHSLATAPARDANIRLTLLKSSLNSGKVEPQTSSQSPASITSSRSRAARAVALSCGCSRTILRCCSAGNPSSCSTLRITTAVVTSTMAISSSIE
ncbi:hypothetical protein MICRO11B_400003 [Micrococcus luteus]|nr:hypothetical protein MICRO11B_400003 [Micrococcus luteus]